MPLSNALVEGMVGMGERLFPPNSLGTRILVLGSAELSFIRTVSWLYVQFIEGAGISVGFLRDRPVAYGVRREQSEFPNRVKQLRTYFQHNLDSVDSAHDRDILEACEEWYLKVCGTRVP